MIMISEKRFGEIYALLNKDPSYALKDDPMYISKLRSALLDLLEDVHLMGENLLAKTSYAKSLEEQLKQEVYHSNWLEKQLEKLRRAQKAQMEKEERRMKRR